MGERLNEAAYVSGVAAVTATLVFLEGLRVGAASAADYVYLVLIAVATLPVAILLLSTAVYVFLRPRKLPHAHVDVLPEVAVLYAVYNDILPEAVLSTLRNLRDLKTDVWLLSDSDRAEALETEAGLPASVRIFRRATRRGGKAGAINDWLRLHGDHYQYIVPMDSDAILRAEAFRALVEIAEHPANRGFGGFQSLMEVHPVLARTPFSRIVGRGVKWSTRIIPLANQRLFGRGMYWGSNALLRREAVEAVGGWVEENICEDFALTARLDAAGYPIALVDVYNFEGFPPDALSLRERTMRWCRANLSVAPIVFRSRTGFAVRLSVVIPILFYLMAPVLLTLLLLSVVSPPDAPAYRFTSAVGLSLLAFLYLHRLVAVPRDRRSLRRYLSTLAVETAVILGMSLRVASVLLTAAFRRPSWVPSRKHPRALTPSAAVRASLPETSFGGVLLFLVVLCAPPLSYSILASVWILSFLATPFVLWISGNQGRLDTDALDESPVVSRILALERQP